MHITRIHEMIEKLTECALCELDKGPECVDTKEFGEVIDMIEDLAEAEYKARISKAMEKAEEEEEAEEKYMLSRFKEEYGEDGERRYYDEWRYRSGRFAPKGRGTRRGFIEPPYYHMMPDAYGEHELEHWRDMDKDSHSRMYYTEPMTMHDGKYAESKYDKARRGYEETKAMHKGNTPEDKQHKMKSLEEYMRELSDDITIMLTDMTPEEKTLMKNKMSVLMQKL